MNEGRIEMAEHVLPGHPDKLCDALVDALVDHVRMRDPEGQCGLEAACVFDRVYLTGRIAARDAAVTDELVDGALSRIVRATYRSAGYGEDAAGHGWAPAPESLRIDTTLCAGPFASGERELRHLSDDQALCVGYANDRADTDHLPPAVWLARRIARALVTLREMEGAGEVGPDGKVVVRVRVDDEGWSPEHVSVSLNHHEESDWLVLRRIAEAAVEGACAGRASPELVLNGAGMFVAGGPNGDNGLAGKKLVVDAYGPGVPIGGGAWSGKDLRKVDRLGGLLARAMARRCVAEGLGREALVTLEYTPGCAAPVFADVRLDGHPAPGIAASLLADPGASNDAAWRRYVTCDADLVALARWGHQQAGTPWESEGLSVGRAATRRPRAVNRLDPLPSTWTTGGRPRPAVGRRTG